VDAWTAPVIIASLMPVIVFFPVDLSANLWTSPVIIRKPPIIAVVRAADIPVRLKPQKSKGAPNAPDTSVEIIKKVIRDADSVDWLVLNCFMYCGK
jgi:hypothetical protein